MPHIELIVTTAIAGAVGWLVKEGFNAIKALINMLKTYQKESREWRESMDEKVDTMMGATQTTMRATLIHNYEKYAERGWLTPEERASWCDMHDKYSAMGFNGLIDTYRAKLDALPDREI